jgi:hemoglobin/transferrin/lactoferrin receptor protein
MKKNSLILVFIFCWVSIFAQERSVIVIVSDGNSGNALIGAHISIYNSVGDKLISQGITDRDGTFTIKGLPEDKLIVTASYLGFRFSKLEIEAGSSNPSEFNIKLLPSSVEVGEVTVSSLKQDKNLRDVSLPIALVNKNRIDELPAITPANLFQDTPGVNLARDGIWATSLNIRGLTEQRIVTLVDGNRIETATDIAGGLAMIDVNDIERIEVIKGAASSLYGTGALGGVVNIVTREGHYRDKFYAGGSLAGMYQTVNHLQSGNASFDLADQKWYMRISGTTTDAGNTMTPKGELSNSQFADNNISLKLGVKPFKNQEFNLNYQKFEARDVGIPGGNAFLLPPNVPPAIAIYPLEQRNMLSATYTINRTEGLLSRLKFKYFHQYILRDVELKPSPAATITPTGNHTTSGFQFQSDWNFGDNNQLIAGLDIWQRYLSTKREKKVVTPVTDSVGTITGKNTTIRGEVPIPDAWFTSGGIFVQDQISLMDKKLMLTLGGRLDLINTRNERALDPVYLIKNGLRNDNPPKQRITFEANNINNTSWSLDAGALYHLFPKTDLTLNLSRAYRAPGIEERFKYIDLGSTVRLGDPNLKPEQGYFFDLGTRIWQDKFQFTGNIFANKMSNLIVEMPGTFIYNYSTQPENYDTLNALVNSNVDKALLYGFDASAEYNVVNGLTIKGMAGYVRGKNLEDTINKNLPQIPPLNGRLTLKYHLSGIFSTEVSANLSADQEKIVKKTEKPTKGFVSYDFGIYSAPVKLWNIRIEAFGGIQNITDRAYMNHLSTNRGVIKYEPGRNFYLKLLFSF